MRRILATAVFLTLLSSAVFAQAPAAKPPDAAKPDGPLPTFDVADVHPSPKVRFASIYPDGGVLHGDRFVLRQASMADLISRAYGIQNLDNIYGGPSWL